MVSEENISIRFVIQEFHRLSITDFEGDVSEKLKMVEMVESEAG